MDKELIFGMMEANIQDLGRGIILMEMENMNMLMVEDMKDTTKMV